MTGWTLTPAPAPVRALSRDMLASVLDQSVDCVKLVGLDGRVEYMNFNGQCALEIDDVGAILGQPWTSLWPEEARGAVADACFAAGNGRSSRFDAFCPTAKGTPKWWNVSASPVRDADGEITGVLSISRDITEAELTRQALEVTTAEMRHRLRNSYAMVGSLLTGLARGTPEHEAFAQEMSARLQALARAQTMSGFDAHALTLLPELIPALVEVFDRPDCPVRVASVPDRRVERTTADAIALVLGELAVNSAKHGALGGLGQIDITAGLEGGQLEIRWSERSDRPVAAHAREGGQGLNLMQRIVTARGGRFGIEWRDDGLDATLSLPLG